MTEKKDQFQIRLETERSSSGAGFDASIGDSLDPTKLLRGVYEVASLPTPFHEDHPVPRFSYNILNRRGELYQPVLDQSYLEDGNPSPEWPGDAEFAVCLTHDLDTVSQHNPRETLRKGIQRAKLRARPDRHENSPSVINHGYIESLKGLAGGF